MLSSITINGKSYSLSSFGIKTLGVLNASENEENAFHIDGDSEDSLVSGHADKLMAALSEDPDTVMTFFKELTSKVYDKINAKMRSTTISSLMLYIMTKRWQRSIVIIRKPSASGNRS